LNTPSEVGAAPTRPSLAASLSFLWPGLGHLYARRYRAAALFGVPVLILAGYVLIQLLGGVDLFAVQLLDPSFAIAVVAWTIVVGIWRLLAIGTAWRLGARSARASSASRTVLALLVVLVVGMHAVVGYLASSFYQAGSIIFEPSPDGTTPPVALGSPSLGPTFSLAPGATPTIAPTPVPVTNRTTILLTGVDSGHDREHALTDTLLVVSVDSADKTAVMMSIPRDISDFQLYSGGIYHGKINSLMTAARLDPKRFPDGPMGTLTRQIGFIIGVPVDYYAQINLEGFEQMVNLVGGVDIDNPRAIDDPLYDWFDGTHGFQLSAGPHHLDGRLALAYVRSRQGVGDSDFTRARRQQQVLGALRLKMTTPAGLRQLPGLLDAASRTIRTDFPAERLRDYLALAKEVGDAQTQRYVLGPPYARTPTTPGSTYVLLIDRDRIASLSIKVFGSDSAYATP
jgi:LCP family protein required for cell wall assembly